MIQNQHGHMLQGGRHSHNHICSDCTTNLNYWFFLSKVLISVPFALLESLNIRQYGHTKLGLWSPFDNRNTCSKCTSHSIFNNEHNWHNISDNLNKQTNTTIYTSTSYNFWFPNLFRDLEMSSCVTHDRSRTRCDDSRSESDCRNRPWSWTIRPQSSHPEMRKREGGC